MNQKQKKNKSYMPSEASNNAKDAFVNELLTFGTKSLFDHADRDAEAGCHDIDNADDLSSEEKRLAKQKIRDRRKLEEIAIMGIVGYARHRIR